MTDSFDIVRDLPAALADRSAAWTYIRGLAATWARPLSGEDGTPEADLVAAEEDLGVRLPPALREAYGLFGRRKDLHSNLHWLLSPDEFYVDDRKEALVFRDENQGVTSWGIPLAHLGEADPPVLTRLDLADNGAERWEPWLAGFSVSCVEIVLSELPQADDDLCDYCELEDEDELPRRFTRLPFPAHPEGQEGQSFYSGPGLLLCDGGGSWLSVRAQDEETLARLRDDFPGDWVNG